MYFSLVENFSKPSSRTFKSHFLITLTKIQVSWSSDNIIISFRNTNKCCICFNELQIKILMSSLWREKQIRFFFLHASSKMNANTSTNKKKILSGHQFSSNINENILSFTVYYTTGANIFRTVIQLPMLQLSRNRESFPFFLLKFNYKINTIINF